MPRIVLNLTEQTRTRVFTEADLERLSALGEMIRFDPQQDTEERFRGLLADADAVLTCWGSRAITAADLPADPRPSRPLLIAHAAGSVRGLVSDKAILQRGDVRLSQGAAAVAPAVAHYTVGLMLLALRQTFWRHDALRRGEKASTTAVPYRELTGLTVGIVSLSRVGQAVLPLLAPFGCRVVAWDPYWTTERARGIGAELGADLDELLQICDVVSLHLPVTPETQNLIDARRIALLRPGSVLINTARGTILDQSATFARAMQGEIEYYADVSVPEPLPPDHPAWQSPHIFLTPHIAGPTQQTLRRMAEIAIEEIARFLRNEPLQHEVTGDRYDLLA